MHGYTRHWVWAIGAATTLGGCGAPDEGLSPTSSTANVVTCIDQQANDANSYSQPRVFLEAQGWWGAKQADGSFPVLGAAEHLHVAMCFPLQQTVSGSLPFRVRIRGHNLPIGSVIETTNLHDPEGGSFIKLHWDDTITAATSANFEDWKSATVNTTTNPSGLREFRILTIVKRPDNAEIHASSGWCWHVANTTPESNSGTCDPSPQSTMARGWYDCFEYKIAETKNWTYPYAGISHNQSYTMSYGARDGAGANGTVTSHQFRFDPDFHNSISGARIDSSSGPVSNQSVTIGASLLTAGTHRIAIIAGARGKCTAGVGIVPQEGEVSGVLLVPLKVN